MSSISSTTQGLCREMRPHVSHLSTLFALSLLGTPLALLTPVPLKIAVDNVLNARPLPRVLGMLLPAAVKHSNRTMLASDVELVVAVAVLYLLRRYDDRVVHA